MLLTYIKEETGCNFRRVIHYPDWRFTWSSHVWPGNSEHIQRFSCKPFSIHQKLPYHSTPYSQIYWQCCVLSRSRYLHALKRRCAVTCLLGLRVRILPVVWMSLSFYFMCCQVEVSATGRSLVQRSPSECGVSNWVWFWNFNNEEPTRAVKSRKIKLYHVYSVTDRNLIWN